MNSPEFTEVLELFSKIEEDLIWVFEELKKRKVSVLEYVEFIKNSQSYLEKVVLIKAKELDSIERKLVIHSLKDLMKIVESQRDFLKGELKNGTI